MITSARSAIPGDAAMSAIRQACSRCHAPFFRTGSGDPPVCPACRGGPSLELPRLAPMSGREGGHVLLTVAVFSALGLILLAFVGVGAYYLTRSRQPAAGPAPVAEERPQEVRRNQGRDGKAVAPEIEIVRLRAE